MLTDAAAKTGEDARQDHHHQHDRQSSENNHP